jgi:hypothetical protein
LWHGTAVASAAAAAFALRASIERVGERRDAFGDDAKIVTEAFDRDREVSEGVDVHSSGDDRS